MIRKKKKTKLTFEQEANVLLFIETCQGNSTRGECRNHMYEIYKLFKNDGRDASVCTCLDGDTAKKVDNFITSYTFSDESRFTNRFHSLLPHLALIKKEAEKPLEEVSTTDLTEGMDKFTKPKLTPIPKKPRKKKTTKKK